MSTTTTVKLGKRAKTRLARLAIGLRTDRKRKTTFSMREYAHSSSRFCEPKPAEIKNECGTTCCAVGHAPLYCLHPKRDESWNEYAARVLGVKDVSFRDSDGRDVFDFLFQSDWPDDIKQFSARVWHVLKTGEVISARSRHFSTPKYPVPRIKDLEAFL